VGVFYVKSTKTKRFNFQSTKHATNCPQASIFTFYPAHGIVVDLQKLSNYSRNSGVMTSHRRFLLPIILMSALWLASCATTPSATAPQNKSAAWDDRVQTLSGIQDWDLNALIAIRARADGDSASLRWQQKKQNYTLNLFGPLGTNSFILRGEPGKVTLQNPKGQTFSAKTPELLVAQQTGWQLPVSYLSYWIRGLPVPNIPAEKHFDAYNHLSELTQEGWKVQFLRYTSTHHIDLPSKIFINSPTLSVKIIISQWQL
jgi:outer membrane lipoprotein LolB